MMMAEDRDLQLQTLFAETALELDGEVFTENVMSKTRRLLYRVALIAASVALVLLVCAWLLALPVQGFAFLVTDVLATTLIDLGDGWAAWIFTPINNIAGLLVLMAKALRVAWKKIMGRSYA